MQVLRRQPMLLSANVGGLPLKEENIGSIPVRSTKRGSPRGADTVTSGQACVELPQPVNNWKPSPLNFCP